MGMVYLIGAGCGAYDLITLRGYELLKQADCILYDRLIDQSLLQVAPPTCECIHVGKRDHHHTMPQSEIEALLIEKATQFPIVIRLKGGDPYVFGRGGEEGLALRQAQIPFEVVPGISSPLATLLFAGFPITHRGINTGFRVYSAHTMADIKNTFDYASMAKSEDTLVFMMGLQHRFTLFQELLAHGVDETMPVALISNGALPTQQVVTTTLQEALTLDVMMQSPCTIVVGKVISLREQLNFYEQLPLFGKRIWYPSLSEHIVTTSLRKDGAIVDEVKWGSIVELTEALQAFELQDYAYLIFTSKNGIHTFMKQLVAAQKDVRSLSHLRIVCVGEKSAQALSSYGLRADLVGASGDVMHLIGELKEISNPGRMLLVKAKNEDHRIQDEFAQGVVDVCECYETIVTLPKVQECSYDALIFTSANAVHACLQQMQHWKGIKQTPVFSIGASTTKAIQDYHFDTIYQSAQTNIESLFDLVRKELSTCTEEED